MKERKFNFGDKVEDNASGYVGIVVAYIEYDTGCIQYAVQGPATKEGKLPHPEYIDVGHLVLLEEAVPKEEEKEPIKRRRTGGLMHARPRHDEEDDNG